MKNGTTHESELVMIALTGSNILTSNANAPIDIHSHWNNFSTSTRNDLWSSTL